MQVEKTIIQYTRYGTVFLAAVQGLGIASGLENLTSSSGPAVMDPGLMFKFTTVVSLTGGTVFLMWLGEQITARGIGNGISLIIMAGIVANLPVSLVSTLELGKTGALSGLFIVFLLLMSVAVIAFIVFVERAQRRLLIQYPKRQVGMKVFQGDSSHLPLKINTAGVIPPIFASSILLLPVTAMSFNAGSGPSWMLDATALLGRGTTTIYGFIYCSNNVFFLLLYFYSF